ncbi:TetR family transcriptional regulator [Xylanimonas protaetiae]|uniref:TetR/AcrR family transcriptional regulator n=1 Tax=Xylanimonas protaetiae TaxID=2509457 RepID=A0A4P6F6J5_9MICO|nr:TetR family transcriptional regulator [Xylanimonas protaetiae]QAY70413.1 TetR/AcrR family transcriptional regulator [Xylanimonas protaetiae]
MSNDDILEAEATARGRILDAAIDCFAREGFGASVRTIAAAADVSPGLITHHFGTKEALRAECDSVVLTRYREFKDDAVDAPSDALRGLFPDPGATPVLVVYMIRALGAGGSAGRRFLAQLVDEARVVMKHSVAAGLVHTSLDEEARLRTLVSQSMGAMLIEFMSDPGASPEEFVTRVISPTDGVVLSLLELYTDGLFVSRDLLDTYLSLRNTPTPSPETED